MEPIAVNRLVGVDNHIIALTYANEEPVCCKRYNWYKVHSDDRHIVLVEADFEIIIRAGVNQAKPILLAFLDFVAMVSSATLSIDIRAVNENIVG